MAGGANRKFLSDGLAFMREKVIDVQVRPAILLTVAAASTDDTWATLATRGRVANGDVGLGADATVKAGVYHFDLMRTEFLATRRTSTLGVGHSTSGHVYQLREWGNETRDQVVTTSLDGNSFTVRYTPPDKAHPIRAYWVPWSSGSCWSVRLGDQADYFFTPTMDGCSLGISSSRSRPYVTHGNYKSVTHPDLADQRRTLRKIRDHHVNTLHTDVTTVLAKDDYVATPGDKTLGINNLVTVIGFRDTGTGRWSFYYQRRRVNAGTHTIALLEGANVLR